MEKRLREQAATTTSASHTGRRRQIDIEDAVAWAFHDEQAHRANGGYEGRLSWPARSGCGICALGDIRVQGSGVAGMMTSSSTPAGARRLCAGARRPRARDRYF